MNDFTAVFLVSFVVGAVLAWPIFRGLIALKSRQTVSQFVAEHAHKQGTPTMGGLIILAGALAGMGFWASRFPSAKVIPSFVLVIGYALIGFFDDFVMPRVKKGSRGFGWIPKLMLQIGIACLAVWLKDSSMSVWNFGLSVFLILFFANGYNFSDGLDWLAGTLLVALCAGLIAVSLRLGLGEWAFPLIALLGGVLPFLFLNAPPAKVFMGDVGSMGIGGMLGLVVSDIALQAHGGNAVSIWLGLLLVGLVMIIELVPPPMQIFSVKVFKRKIFPFTPIHHAFQRAGWPEIKIVALFFTLQLAGSVIGFWVISQAAG